MTEARTRYVQAREALLLHITETLKRDVRFVAAWLVGSYGRGDQKWSSDLDLHVVVAGEYSELLCAQPWSVGAKTTPERLALFKQFGVPAIIYDAHANNTIGGTFTYVLYREVRAALQGERIGFTKASRIQLYCTQEEQVAVMSSLCDEMEALAPDVVDLGGYVPDSPRSVIEMRLLLLS